MAKYEDILEEIRKRTQLANTELNNVQDAINYGQSNGRSFESLDTQLKNSRAITRDYAANLKRIADRNNIAYSNTEELTPTLSSLASKNINKKAWEQDSKLPTNIVDIAKRNEQELQNEKKRFNETIGNTQEYKDYQYRINKLNPTLRYARDVAELNEKGVSGLDKVFSPLISGLDNIKTNGTFKQDNNSRIMLPTLNDLKTQKATENANWLYKGYADISQSVGNMLPGIAASAINPALGSALFFGNTYQNARNQALLEGYDESSASNYGVINATLELGVGKVLGGTTALLGKSPVSKLIGDKITSKLIVNPAINSAISDMMSEFGEEYIQEWLDPKVKAYILDKKDLAEAWESSKFFDKQNFYAGLLGALSAGITNTPGTIRQNSALNSEFEKIVDTLQKDGNEKLTNEQLKQLKKTYYKEYNKALKNDTEIDYENISNKLTNENRTEQSLTKNIEELKEQQKQTTDNKLKQELATRISGLEQELNQFKLPMASTEGMTLQESASKYDIKPETQTLVQQLMENRGIEARWDSTKFNDNSVNALWTKDANGNRQVIFNPNASLDTIVEEVAMHELTHDILSSANTTLNPTEILDYVSQLDGYNEARQNLIETYKDMYDVNSAEFNSLIDEEVVADVLGRKLGNQEFINQLVNSKPSIAKSIYNWVVSKLNSIVNKGKVRSEKLYWQNIKNNFENAYRQEYQNNKVASTKYKVSEPYSILDNKKEFELGTYQKGLSKTDRSYDYNKVYEFGIKNGGRGDNVQVSVTKNGYVWNNAMLSDSIKGKGEGTKIALDLNQQSLKETGKPLRSLPEYNIVGTKNHTEEGKGLWESLVRKGYAVKNSDNTYTMKEDAIPGNETKYSKESKEWNEFLDKNFKDTGTSGTLMALHSLSEDKLLSLLDLDGIPVPSLGITDANSSDVLDEFGGKNGVFLIFSKDTINPKNKLNEVYSRDIYSKTVPEIYQKVDKKLLNEKLAEFRPYESEYGTFNKHDFTKSSLDSIVNDLQYSDATKAKFLDDNNYQYEKVYRNYKSRYGFTEEVIDKFIKEHPDLASFNPYSVGNTNEITELAPKIKEIALDMMAESDPRISRKQLEVLFKDKWYLQDVIDFYNDIKGYQRLNGQKEFDSYATRDNISKAVEQHQEEYENWLRNKFIDVYGEKYFENDRGTKKDYTLENLTSYMKKGNTKAQQKGMFNTYGIGQAKGDSAKRYMSIEQIKLASENLVDAETYKARHEAFEQIDEDVRIDIGDTRISNGEDVFEVYSDYYKALGQTARGVDAEKALKNNNFNNLSDKQIQEFKEVANDLSNLPAKYFEAKPQRAVGLDEVQAIVIPNTAKESTRQAIRDKGIDFIEYDPNVDGDRQRIINKFDNLKFSKNSPEWENFVNKHIAPEGTKTKLKDIKLPKKEINLPSTPKKQTILPMAREDNVLKVNANEIADFMNGISGNQRGWAKTATESDVLKDKVLIKDLDANKLNYVVESNQKSVDTANNHLNTYGYEKSLEDVKSLLRSDKLPKASDVALAERVLQEAVRNGDTKTAQDLIMDIAILGTDLGQATQALSIIKRLTPEGQLSMYTKMIQRAKSRGEKSFENVEITPEMVEMVLNAYKSDGTYDQEDLNNRVENFKQEIANQMKTTTGEKINAWRYLAMLGNPKTHIRNIVSNVAMNGTIKVKNAMARTLESVLPIKNRTKTWKKASNFIKNYAETTANEMKGIITGENKYNEKSSLESKKRTFKSDTLEKISNFNSNALEAEDWFFSKRAFISNLEEYLTANGINTQEDIESRPEVVEKAKNYAKEQAEIATFRQYSKLAAQINNLEKNSKFWKFFIEATIPFKKTPINVAKAGVNYSPIGLIKSLSYDIYQVKKGNMEASQLIDNISQGLTGTSLAILGYSLAKAGILNGAGGEDKDDKYDTQLGDNQYSLKIGDKSYSISWLSPVAMPLLVGANAYEQLEEKEEWDMNVVSETLAKTLDPLNEMSFMQGLTNALSSYNSGVEKLAGIGESVAQNYVGQFFPTLFSQFASTIDDKKRSTKASNNSSYKFGEQTLRSVMYKLPGLRQQLEVATDVWGNEKEQADNIIQRAYESFLAPYSTTKNITSDLDKEIKSIYNKTNETGVIPSVPYSYIKYKDETYRMSANEYTKYKKTFGQNANKYLNNLISSNAYKNASDDDKAKMIKNTYDYAKAEANEECFKSQSIDYTSDTLKELNALKKIGINDKSLSEYISNKTLASTIKSNSQLSANEKHKKIADNLIKSNLNDKQLAYLYGKYYSTDDKLNNLVELNIPIKEFIKLNSQDIESDYNSATGKTISNSKKKKVINYINSLNLSVPQKAILIKSQYNTFNTYNNEIVNYVNNLNKSVNDKKVMLKSIGFDNYDNDVINYINSQNMSIKDKEKKLKSLGFTIRNGRVYK